MRCQSVAWRLRAKVLLGLLLCTLVSPAHAVDLTFTLQVTTTASSGAAPPPGSITSNPTHSGIGDIRRSDPFDAEGGRAAQALELQRRCPLWARFRWGMG